MVEPGGMCCLHGRTRAQMLKAEATGPMVPAAMGTSEPLQLLLREYEFVAQGGLTCGRSEPPTAEQEMVNRSLFTKWQTREGTAYLGSR